MKKNDPVCDLSPEDDAEIIDTPIAKFWMDRNGILYSDPHEIVRNEENIKQSFTILLNRLGDKKYCMISKATRTAMIPKEMRGYVKEKYTGLIKAHALIICSPAGKMIAHVNFFVRKPPYPLRMFTNIHDAREWLQQYL